MHLTEDLYSPYVDLLSNEWWNIPIEHWSRGLTSLEMHHAAARHAIIRDRAAKIDNADPQSAEYKNLKRELVLYGFVQEMAAPMAAVFGTMLDNHRVTGSWRQIDSHNSGLIESAIRHHMEIPDMADYRGELILLRSLVDASGERNFHNLGSKFSKLALSKYKAGMPVLYHDIHSYARDMRVGLGGKLQYVEPDMRVYKPSNDYQMSARMALIEQNLNQLHSRKDKRIHPLIMDYVMSTGWLPSMTSGEAMYNNTFMVVRNLQKDEKTVAKVFDHLGIDVNREDLSNAVIMLMAAHEGAHLYYWYRNQPFAGAVYEEVFADVPAVITMLRLGIDVNQVIPTLVAAYLPYMAPIRKKDTPDNEWGYVMSANLVMGKMADSGLLRNDYGQMVVDRRALERFEAEMVQVHAGLWRKDAQIMNNVLVGELSSRAQKLVSLKNMF